MRRIEPLEIHGQERHVVDHVDVAQPIVELDAVEDPGPVVEQEHVVGQQVAVTVADPAVVDPLREQRAPTLDEPPDEVLAPDRGRRA